MHKYDRAEMKKVIAEAEAKSAEHLPTHFGPENNLLPELAEIFRSYGETGRGKRRFYLHNEQEAAPVRPAARHLHAVGRVPRAHRPAVLRRPARRLCRRGSRRRPACRPGRRRGAGGEPRVDPEDPPRHRGPRLLGRGGDAHHPAPHARLRESHLPAVLAHPHQLPARADGRHLQPVHLARHPDAGRIAGGDPLPRLPRRSISPTCST